MLKRIILILGVFTTLLHCSETNFKGPDVPASARDTAKMQRVKVVYTGKLIHDSEWLRTFAVSRLFSHRASNQTGSFVEIMEGPIASALQGKDYLIDSSASDTITIELQQRELQWYPPQEFIQTVRPHRRGRYVVNLQILVTYPDGKNWTFAHNIEGEAFPGEELQRIEAVVQGLLGEFLWGMLDHLQPARRTVP